MSAESVIKNLQSDIERGTSLGTFLGRLSETNMSKEEIVATIAHAAEVEADRKFNEAQVVAKSVVGVEDLAGTASFEVNRAIGLINFANKLRGF